jgi:ferredoxin-NADP reductase
MTLGIEYDNHFIFKLSIMSEYVVKVLETSYVTHDVKRFVLEKPEGYNFVPGQATDLAVNMPDWKDELRPFTFTCLNDRPYLEFMIKIYKDHKGVTNFLGQIDKGDEVILHDVFGAIQYRGKGVFIAGGAGITPFIAIFRDLHRKNQLGGNKLFFSNKTLSDVILEEELTKMLKTDFVKIFTRENSIGLMTNRIDKKILADYITNIDQKFYICGPDQFVQDMSYLIVQLGALPDTVVFEM